MKKKKRYPYHRYIKVHDRVNNHKGLPPKRKHRRKVGKKDRPKKNADRS